MKKTIAKINKTKTWFFEKNKIDLCYFFFVSMSFISALIFMISFLLLTLGIVVVVVLLSLVALGVRIGCLFGIFFFLFPEVRLYWCKLPSESFFCCISQVLYHCTFVFICLQAFFDFFSDPLVVQQHIVQSSDVSVFYSYFSYS